MEPSKRLSSRELALQIDQLLTSSNSTFYTNQFASSGGGLELISTLSDSNYMNESESWKELSSLPHPPVANSIPESGWLLSLLPLQAKVPVPFDAYSICLEAPLDGSAPPKLCPFSTVEVPTTLSGGDHLVHVLVVQWWPFGRSKTEPPPQVLTKKIWYPSTVHVSLAAQWWGFSIYLPHPAMLRLDPEMNGVADDLSKISNILTNLIIGAGALGAVVPAAALLALKGLGPIIGYIAAFIRWSWKELKSLDKGSGIILSATWILPVAMIPRSWDAPTPPAPATSTPPPVNETPSN